jgi:hypothetical protein
MTAQAMLNLNDLCVEFLQSPFAVILSEAKNLALDAQDKLREGSGSAFLG